MNRVHGLFGWVVVAGALASAPLQTAFSQTYSITELGTLGGTRSIATDMNEAGQVVGTASLPGNSATHAFIFFRGKMRDLGTFGGRSSVARSINNRGQVTGETTYAAFPNRHGFLYSRGVVRDIGVLDVRDDCVLPSSINDAGEITGTAGCRHPVAFGFRNGQLFQVAGPGGDGLSINNRGQILANAELPGLITHAFLYTNGSLLDLGTLGGPVSLGLSSHAINRHGEVTGVSEVNVDGESHAFLYSNGSMRDLGTLGGGLSYGNAINDRGQVVGDSVISNNSDLHAFLFSKGRMIDIGTLGGSDSTAEAINNDGVVIGDSTTMDNKETHAFIYRGHRLLDLNSLVDNKSPLKKSVTLTKSVAINGAGDIVAQGINSATGISSAYLLEECLERYSQSRYSSDDEPNASQHSRCICRH